MVDVIDRELVFSPGEIWAGFPASAPLESATGIREQIPKMLDRLGERAIELVDSDLHTERDLVPAVAKAQLILSQTGVQLSRLPVIIAEDEAALLRAKS